jgi:hypothetical protein
VEPKTLHFKINPISRNKARPDNAVKACAYRCGQNLRDVKTGKLHRYARRGGVIQTGIFAAEVAPGWMQDDDQKRAWGRFGNEIEAIEDRHNRRDAAQLAKDFHAAAPREITLAQAWEKIAVPFARKLTDRGLTVAVALHETDASDGGKNPHFHFLVGMRQTTENGFSRRKERWLDSREGVPNPELMALRREYFALVNDALADAGVTEIYYDPEKQEDKTPGKHKGKVAWALERKETERRLQAEYRAMDALLLPAIRGIEQRGEAPQSGMGNSRWERLAFLADAAEEYEQYLKEMEAEEQSGAAAPGSWQDYVTGRREVGLDSDSRTR